MAVAYLILEVFVDVYEKEMRKQLFKRGATMNCGTDLQPINFFFQLIEIYKAKNTWKKLLET